MYFVPLDIISGECSDPGVSEQSIWERFAAIEDELASTRMERMAVTWWGHGTDIEGCLVPQNLKVIVQLAHPSVLQE